ncbi:hypothetical protein BC941DRAFT_441987 [Chlamydoabsidia padenii]|nr:hypothetical protein BC941DRAFT_441987 [Chlamydoabsidia padenii]
MCRIIYGSITVDNAQTRCPGFIGLQLFYDTLTSTYNINLLVPLNNLRNYGQIVSTACVTLATCYNNYCVIVANYFINSIKNEHQVHMI